MPPSSPANVCWVLTPATRIRHLTRLNWLDMLALTDRLTDLHGAPGGGQEGGDSWRGSARERFCSAGRMRQLVQQPQRRSTQLMCGRRLPPAAAAILTCR